MNIKVKNKLEGIGFSVFEVKEKPKMTEICLKQSSKFNWVDNFIKFLGNIKNPIVFMHSIEVSIEDIILSEEEAEEEIIAYIFKLMDNYEHGIESDDEKERFIYEKFGKLIKTLLTETKSWCEELKIIFERNENTPYCVYCYLFTYYNDIQVYSSWLDEQLEYPEDKLELKLEEYGNEIIEILEEHFEPKKTKEELRMGREEEYHRRLEEREEYWKQQQQEKEEQDKNGLKLLEDLKEYINNEDEEKIKSLTNDSLRRMYAKEIREKGKEKYGGKATCAINDIMAFVLWRYKLLKDS